MFLREEIVEKISKHNRRRKRKIYIFQCDYCGKEYELKYSYKKAKNKPKTYCSQECFQSTESVCIICGNNFKVNSTMQKTCSAECASKKNNLRNKIRVSNKAVIRICRFCGNEYKRYIKRNGFCTRSCASKYYVENGTYDNWINHRKQSKAQKELFNLLTIKFPFLEFEFDGHLKIDKNRYFADIISKKYNIIIEFNGTYWHCDKRFYKPDFYHTTKKKTAKQIWLEDSERISDFENNGYKVFLIWEYDYKLNKNNIIENLYESIQNIINHEKI